MSTLAEKFIRLKTSVGGNRQKKSFEFTMGAPLEEKAGITRPSRANVRILSELEFVLHLSEENAGAFDAPLTEALDFLLSRIAEEGVLTNRACEEAEALLAPAEAAAKEYQLILASHAHIDMNWMWSFNETVAVTLATFRSILNIMNEYPDFCFSQSQASVYKIVEEYDPAMMEEIKARIAEGRWEVTATAWVECDKNMPSGESLLRHIEYTKKYLKEVWGVKRLDIDFSPDTFGHSANVPEIDAYGDVKYYYHCRGNARKQNLYRYRALSGKEVLVYREPFWYNSGIIPEIGTSLIEMSRLSGGLKTGLIVYGVGDHGGGPTRRDVERALEMMSWRIFPRIRFGTLHEFFDTAMSVWEKLPVVTEEMNFIFQGCYSTQSRIKRGNRRMEAALFDAESIGALSGRFAHFPYAKEQLTGAWQNVLFTHFHDIITGSCVRDSREWAMGLYQRTAAVTNTQIQNAMREVALKIDTSGIPVDIDAYNSQSEGAGTGYGIENFVGVPSTERGSGRTRIFHVFNTLPFARKECVELAVFDWTGDLCRIGMKDADGNAIPFQLLDENHNYWDHQVFRVLAEVKAPALGYTTVVLYEKEAEEVPVLMHEIRRDRIGKADVDPLLENERIAVRIDAGSGRIVSMVDKASGAEMIKAGESAGFTYVESEKPKELGAWTIGRHIRELPVDHCVSLEVTEGGLRQSVKVRYAVQESRLEAEYTLDAGDPVVKIAVRVDWLGHGNDRDYVPLLNYRIPLAYETREYLYDIPAGAVVRKEMPADVPGLKYGLALRKSRENAADPGTGSYAGPAAEAPCAILISDSKYGYRGNENALALTLINSAVEPDPYPELGIHNITLFAGVCPPEEKTAEDLAVRVNHAMFYQPGNCRKGSLPLNKSLFAEDSEGVVISAVLPEEDGSILVRGYETKGQDGVMALAFTDEVEKAEAVKLSGEVLPGKVKVEGKRVTLKMAPNTIAAVRVRLK